MLSLLILLVLDEVFTGVNKSSPVPEVVIVTILYLLLDGASDVNCSVSFLLARNFIGRIALQISGVEFRIAHFN